MNQHINTPSGKVSSALPWINAGISLLAALLGAAPFTPAPIIFAATLPFAAAVTIQRPQISTLAVVGTFVLSVAISPIKLPQLLHFPVNIWFAWTCLTACLALLVAVPLAKRKGAVGSGQTRGDA